CQGDEHADGGGDGRGDERDRGPDQDRRHQAPAGQEVAEGDDESQPGGVAELRRRHDEAGGAGAGVKDAGDGRQQRLRVVEVRGGGAGGDREDDDEAPVDAERYARRRYQTRGMSRYRTRALYSRYPSSSMARVRSSSTVRTTTSAMSTGDSASPTTDPSTSAVAGQAQITAA